MGDPQESANERRHEHVEAVERILDSVDPALEEHAYPVNSEDLSAQYAESIEGLPNETESLGSVFDRLDDDEYDSPMAVKEAVLREVSDAAPSPTTAGEDRDLRPGAQGAPQEVLDDLESEAVAEAEREGGPTDVEREAADVGTPADTASGPESDAAGPGDAMTPETTEAGEFAPQESVEDRDREGDLREVSDRASGDAVDPQEDRWDAAAVEPGDPAEPTTEPAEAELPPEEREADLPDAREAADAAAPSERARYDGEDEEPPAEGSEAARAESEVPDARDEESDVARSGNLPDDESADGEDPDDAE